MTEDRGASVRETGAAPRTERGQELLAHREVTGRWIVDKSDILAIEREAASSSTHSLDVERLARSLEILRTPKAQENVWWEAETYPKQMLTHFGFADRIAAEYARLSSLNEEQHAQGGSALPEPER